MVNIGLGVYRNLLEFIDIGIWLFQAKTFSEFCCLEKVFFASNGRFTGQTESVKSDLQVVSDLLMMV